MGLKEEMKKKEFDVRLINWNIRMRPVDDQNVQKHLDKLEDLSSNVEYVKIDSSADEEIVQH